MPRTARLDAPGTLHHVIVSGIERRHIIDDNEDRKAFVERMGHLAFDTKTVIYIDLNPLRAGLVERPKEYRWNSIGYHNITNRN